MTGSDLKNIVDGLEKNGLLRYDKVLSGYIGETGFLEEVSRQVKRIKEVNTDLQYFCDPVLGDKGHFYVPDNFSRIYRQNLLP